jgi:hypothetical protein
MLLHILDKVDPLGLLQGAFMVGVGVRTQGLLLYFVREMYDNDNNMRVDR